MPLDISTFDYLKPTDEQVKAMGVVRAAAAEYARVLDEVLPDGPDKTYILRSHRSNAMWANAAITREADGRPRESKFWSEGNAGPPSC